MTEFHLVAFYQYRENYGAHAWDGKGECPQQWKNKGGSDEVVAVLTSVEVATLGADQIEALVYENAYEYSGYGSEQSLCGFELITIDTDLLVRVRDALELEWHQDDDLRFLEIAINLRIPESIAKIAIEKLDDPTLVLPLGEDEPLSKWDDFEGTE